MRRRYPAKHPRIRAQSCRRLKRFSFFPGEFLAAALESCLDTTIRMIANLKRLKPTHLEVHVSFGADVSGTLMTGDNAPVGF